ncbi:MAG: hypothetical protein WEB06_13600 [Actinomycetota bacterium]
MHGQAHAEHAGPLSDADLRREVAAAPVPSFPDTAFARPPRLTDACVAVVTTAGLHRQGDEGWTRGDQSFRVLPHDDDALVLGHASANVDYSGAALDLNVVLPRDRLDELAADGIIGSVAPRHIAFMGAQHNTLSTLRLDTGPAAASMLLADGVDVALLTPACPMCTRTVCTLAHVLEREGLATVAIAFVPELAERIQPPRALCCEFPFGRPLGRPGEPAFQRRVIEAAFELLAAPRGPVLARFPEVVPDQGEGPLDCLVPPQLDPDLPVAIDEAIALRPAFERQRRQRRRGLARREIDPDAVVSGIERFARIAEGERWDAEEWERDPTQVALDIRWYFEEVAIALAPHVPAAQATRNWLFQHTQTGRTLIAARERMREQGAPRDIWRRLVPLGQVLDPGEAAVTPAGGAA